MTKIYIEDGKQYQLQLSQGAGAHVQQLLDRLLIHYRNLSPPKRQLNTITQKSLKIFGYFFYLFCVFFPFVKTFQWIVSNVNNKTCFVNNLFIFIFRVLQQLHWKCTKQYDRQWRFIFDNYLFLTHILLTIISI